MSANPLRYQTLGHLDKNPICILQVIPHELLLKHLERLGPFLIPLVNLTCSCTTGYPKHWAVHRIPEPIVRLVFVQDSATSNRKRSKTPEQKQT